MGEIKDEKQWHLKEKNEANEKLLPTFPVQKQCSFLINNLEFLS